MRCIEDTTLEEFNSTDWVFVTDITAPTISNKTNVTQYDTTSVWHWFNASDDLLEISEHWINDTTFLFLHLNMAYGRTSLMN